MSPMQSFPVRLDVIGTAVFALAVAVAVPLRDERPIQVMIITVSLVLFAVGVFASLSAYVSALERSRVHEIGVANLYLLTGDTAPKPVRRVLLALLSVQVVAALVGAGVGMSGLTGNELNALAFGVLVPMFGIGMNGVWAARYGSFGPRLPPRTKPSNRRIE